MMDYEDFLNELQQEIQARSLRHIDFTIETVKKTNEILEGMAIRYVGQAIAPTVYPKRMYEAYQDGISLSEIVDYISPTIFDTSRFPPIPELTYENAKKNISFSLINKEKNKELLKQCPYKEIHDMAAVPSWHVNDEASFIVNNNVMQMLRMTREEVIDIAQRNTENAAYVCQRLDDVVKNILLDEEVDKKYIDEILPMGASPLYMISNPQISDGSCAILCDSFLQKTAEQIGTTELYLLPSSRHEMLAVNAHAVPDSSRLKDMVMEANSSIIQNEGFLSNSIYKYDANTHTISVCDSNGLFHDKGTVRSAGQDGISAVRGRRRI